MINNSSPIFLVPSRRFGRTEIDMPVLSLGGMRFQESWEDVPPEKIKLINQQNLENIIKKAYKSGLRHIETARHYGSSERQLGWAFQKFKDSDRLIQTKVPPSEDPEEFESQLELSFQRLKCKKIDLLSIHGINLPKHLDFTLRKGGCIDVVRKWQVQKKISHVGFSTHGTLDLILEAIKSDQFDYVNLHWYFINQENAAAIDLASKYDLGVFIISPTDKGGHLHTPSNKLLELCDPFHPIVFNDLFCLKDKRVHTISVGMSNPKDLDLHIQAVKLIEKADSILPPIEKKLWSAAENSLTSEWLKSWHIGLPSWQNTPGEMNIKTLLWLYNLLVAWGMEDYAKARYGLLGKAGHWFPGNNADALDKNITEKELIDALNNSPWQKTIPKVLRELRRRVGGDTRKRLWST